jgi:hypothetical protein
MKYKHILLIVGAIIAISFMEYLNFWGIVIFILMIGGYMLYSKRDIYVNGMRQAETMIWGKPLDRDLWDKKEMKNTKVVIGFGKSKYIDPELIIKLGLLAIIGIIIFLVVMYR